MENTFSDIKHISKKDSFPINNTITCYHRPRLNYILNPKNKTINKIKRKKININFNNSKMLKNFQFHPKIESRIITFSKNNSFEKNNNKENINLNTNATPHVIHKTKSLLNVSSKNLYITNLKFKNINKIKNTNNNKNNKHSSISKEIAILCKIINSINSNSNKNSSKSSSKKITYTNSRKSINISYYKEKKIIKIQRWWRKVLYHLYIEKYILIIQHRYRKYIKKKKWMFDYKNPINIKKIIIIQKSWKKYMKNKSLNNYYFFSFKKCMKPNKNNKLNNMPNSNLIKDIKRKNNNNININTNASFGIYLSKTIPYKNKAQYKYISKSNYRINHINYVNQQIIKLQKKIKQYLYRNKSSYKKLNNNNTSLLITRPILEQSYITKEKKYKTIFINKYIMLKIKKIQKNIKKFMATKNEKMSIFTFNNNNEYEQMIIKSKEMIRKKFSNYISYKLSKLFVFVLNRINIFNFIKMICQRIKKNINQFVFIQILYSKNKKNISNSFFFQTIWRHIKINTNINSYNEISLLLKNCIPKYFHTEFSKKYIPYINYMQEEKLVNTQLFLYNNDELIKYIIYFYEKEKNININKIFINNHLNKFELKNRNIFYITRYIDVLYKDIIKNKIKINVMEDETYSNEENVVEDNCYNQTEEKDYDINNNNEYYNTINTDFVINSIHSYSMKDFSCKFIDYLNKSKKIKNK